MDGGYRVKKIKFEFSEGWGQTTEEIFEFEDDITDEEIESEYETWLWNLIGDKCHWEEVDEGE
jgi:hypothetical protein